MKLIYTKNTGQALNRPRHVKGSTPKLKRKRIIQNKKNTFITLIEVFKLSDVASLH